MPTFTNPLTWVTAQVVTAAELNTHLRDNETVLRANALSGIGELIETLSPSAVTSITTATLPNTYIHLGFVAYDMFGDAAAHFCMRFNGDSGTNYSVAAVGRTDTGSALTTDGASDTSIDPGANLIPDNTAAHRSSLIRGYIASYNNTTLDKVVIGHGWGSIAMLSWGGSWHPGTPAAITTVTFFPSTGNFSGTICVYGLNN